MKRLAYTTIMSPADALDTKVFIDRGIIIDFSLNYRTTINGLSVVVYRVDTFHGPLHEHRFWKGAVPIPLQNDQLLPLNLVFEKYKHLIMHNFEKYKSYYLEAMKHGTIPTKKE